MGKQGLHHVHGELEKALDIGPIGDKLIPARAAHTSMKESDGRPGRENFLRATIRDTAAPPQCDLRSGHNSKMMRQSLNFSPILPGQH